MNTLIAYFSRAGENYCGGNIVSLEEGNTEVVAKKIAVITGGELFKIVPLKPYPDDYNLCVDESKMDKARNERPEIVDCIDSIDGYDTIFLGYPNYWGSLPMCMFTFLEKFDFTGKIIRPFCTHEGSGFGNSIEDIKNTCKGAIVKPGLSIVGSEVRIAGEEIKQWLE